MATSGPLVFLVVHGVGPQDPAALDQFLDRVREATTARLTQIGRPGLLARLELRRVDWSHLFDQPRRNWLASLFPETVHLGRKTVLRKLVRMFWPLSIPLALIVAGTVLGCTSWRFPLGWLIGAVLGVLVALLMMWKVILPRFRWGDAWTLGRPFESHNISDVVLYESDGPRQQIYEQIWDQLEPFRDQRYPLVQGDTTPYVPVILAGHSLGSVAVYDLLMGISARSHGKHSAVVRELEALDVELTARDRPMSAHQRLLEPEERKRKDARREFLRRAADTQAWLCPVGLVTFGSPIALFLFRKPDLLTTKAGSLWEEACPRMFSASGAIETLTQAEVHWRWQNFWHHADFIAHRLQPLFAAGFPGGGQFVEDTLITPPVEGPIDAHSSYWTNQTVLDGIGRQLAEILVALP